MKETFPECMRHNFQESKRKKLITVHDDTVLRYINIKGKPE